MLHYLTQSRNTRLVSRDVTWWSMSIVMLVQYISDISLDLPWLYRASAVHA